MSPFDQRIAIAESVGRKWTEEDTQDSGYKSWHEYVDCCGIEMLDGAIPDYLNDLNAMHEVENALNENQYYLYTLQLEQMAKVIGPSGRWIAHNIRLQYSAPAAQRAEAYLRTIGKWKD